MGPIGLGAAAYFGGNYLSGLAHKKAVKSGSGLAGAGAVLGGAAAGAGVGAAVGSIVPGVGTVLGGVGGAVVGAVGSAYRLVRAVNEQDKKLELGKGTRGGKHPNVYLARIAGLLEDQNRAMVGGGARAGKAWSKGDMERAVLRTLGKAVA